MVNIARSLFYKLRLNGRAGVSQVGNIKFKSEQSSQEKDYFQPDINLECLVSLGCPSQPKLLWLLKLLSDHSTVEPGYCCRKF
jgi:hypothetical protein